MTKRGNRYKELVIVMAAVIIGTGCFFAGEGVASSRYKAEQEMNIMLNRSDLDGLGKITGTIYVTGHKCPDSDTVGSSIAYAHLLCELLQLACDNVSFRLALVAVYTVNYLSDSL